MSEEPVRPVLQVVSANATEEDVAALLAVLSSLGKQAPTRKPAPEWAAPHRRLRRTFPHGPGGWRASSLPR